MNDNGVIDEGTDTNLGTTDENGQLKITDADTITALESHAILASGGTDTTTNLAFEGILKAPVGSTMVNPLTTLVQTFIEGDQSNLTPEGKLV
jgi:hypothetical protein